jgi:RNA polymerase sigma factor (sigma-70 family)
VSPADQMLALYLEHRRALVNYANGIVRDRAGAEDVVQEAYLRLSTVSQEISHPVGYLYRIVRNLALDWARRSSTERPDRAVFDTLEAVPQDAPSAEHVLLFRDELRVVQEALAELPERTQTAFRMYRLEGQTLQQIANHLGVSVVRAHQLVKEAIVHAAQRLDRSEH